VLGTTIITRSQTNAENVYGDFTTTFTLLAWLSLHATVAMFGAELNRSLATSPYWSGAEAAADPVPPDLVGSIDEDEPTTPAAADSGQSGMEAVHPEGERLGERAAAGVRVDLHEAGVVEEAGDGRVVADVHQQSAARSDVAPQASQGRRAPAVVLGAVALLIGTLIGRVTGRQAEHPGDRRV
jgi:hypothetical protein